MFRVRALALWLLICSSVCAWALPMKPDLEKILERQIHKQNYPPARVAWNGAEASPRPPFNPIYESMTYRLSGEAMRQTILVAATPNPRLLISIAGLVFLLRLLRRERARALAPAQTPAPAFVPFPAKEAA